MTTTELRIPYGHRRGHIPEPAHAEALERLNRAAARLYESGGGLPCAGSPLPTSDDPADRREAAAVLCPGCPVQELCAAAGRFESWNVWGGVDAWPGDGARVTQRAAA